LRNSARLSISRFYQTTENKEVEIKIDRLIDLHKLSTPKYLYVYLILYVFNLFIFFSWVVVGGGGGGGIVGWYCLMMSLDAQRIPILQPKNNNSVVEITRFLKKNCFLFWFCQNRSALFFSLSLTLMLFKLT